MTEQHPFDPVAEDALDFSIDGGLGKNDGSDWGYEEAQDAIDTILAFFTAHGWGFGGAIGAPTRPAVQPSAPDRLSVATQLGQLYDDALIQARATAREHGYALAVHGSQMRDLDLIAVPWTDEAVAAVVLAEAIRDAVGGAFSSPPAVRPHGRLAWAIALKHHSRLGDALAAQKVPFHPFIDLSVMEGRASVSAPPPENALVEVCCPAGMPPMDEGDEHLCSITGTLSPVVYKRGVSAPPTDDLSSCAYYRGAGMCSFGCSQEPACMTDRPTEGWPSERVSAPPRPAGEAANLPHYDDVLDYVAVLDREAFNAALLKMAAVLTERPAGEEVSDG